MHSKITFGDSEFPSNLTDEAIIDYEWRKIMDEAKKSSEQLEANDDQRN